MGKIYAIFIELYMKGDLFVRREITHIKRFVLSVPLRYKQFLKGRDFDFDKLNISVCICDTNNG
jgi:hypothetical protein